MRAKITFFALLTVVLLGAVGCRTFSPPPAPLAEMPILVLLPVSSDREEQQACGAIGHHLYMELSRVTGGRAVEAEQIRGLESALTWENLMSGGGFDRDELVAVGRLVGVPSVVAVELLDISAYPPQNVVCRAVRVNVDDERVVSSVHIELSLADPEVKRRYAGFIGERGVNFLRPGGKDDYALETALLSPEVFREFAAAALARSLLRMEDSPGE